jgi:hypothetical protein
MVFGLASPAFAVLGLTGFAPASGPNDCLIVITGTDFEGPDVDTVEVGGVAATFEIQSDTEIWAAAPAGASGFITVEKAATTGESVSSTTQYTNTAGAGGCAPTITSFSPACGLVGTTVTITGTNLIDGSFAGGLVEFSPFVGTNGVDATHTGAAEDPTSLTVLVPATAADGPIAVTTDVSQIFSTTDFNVVTDTADCTTVGPEHARTVTLRLRKHLVAKGTVTADPELAECIAGVTVKIQRKKGGAWKSVGTATTNDAGAYKKRIKDKPGKYRARIGKLSIGDPVTDVCLGDKSPVVRHSH